MESEEQVGVVGGGAHKTASQRLTSSSLEIDTRWILLETEQRAWPPKFLRPEGRQDSIPSDQWEAWLDLFRSGHCPTAPFVSWAPGSAISIPDKSLWAAPRTVMSLSDHQGAGEHYWALPTVPSTQFPWSQTQNVRAGTGFRNFPKSNLFIYKEKNKNEDFKREIICQSCIVGTRNQVFWLLQSSTCSSTPSYCCLIFNFRIHWFLTLLSYVIDLSLQLDCKSSGPGIMLWFVHLLQHLAHSWL